MIVKRIAVIFLILGCLLGGIAAAAEEAHGAESGHEETIWQGLGKWVNFAGLAAILYYFLARTLKVQDRFKEDYHQIQRSIESARQAKEEAERRLAELDERMAHVGEEIARLKDEAVHDAEEEKKRILESAHREAERLLEMAHKEIDTEVEVARRELRRQVADLAVEQGHEIIKREIDEKDKKRLMNEYIEGFGK